MNAQDPHRYDAILDFPHPTSKNHPRMSALNRAAQFAPFAALVGYEAQVEEAGRLTEIKRELDEQREAELDRQLQYLREHIEDHPKIIITHFVPDQHKEGGSYQTLCCTAKKISESQRIINMEDGQTVLIDTIIAIEGP